MKAIIMNQHGGPEVLELVERPVPEPKPGELLIRIQSAGISRPDKLMRTGTYPWTKDILPFYPGLYGAGIVAGLGEGVTGYGVGTGSMWSIPSPVAAMPSTRLLL